MRLSPAAKYPEPLACGKGTRTSRQRLPRNCHQRLSTQELSTAAKCPGPLASGKVPKSSLANGKVPGTSRQLLSTKDLSPAAAAQYPGPLARCKAAHTRHVPGIEQVPFGDFGNYIIPDIMKMVAPHGKIKATLLEVPRHPTTHPMSWKSNTLSTL